MFKGECLQTGQFPVQLLRRVGLTMFMAIITFGSMVRDWTSWNSDLKFVLWISSGFVIETLSTQKIIPSTWIQFVRTLCILPLIHFSLPSCFQNVQLVATLRAFHVGLLTGRGGYNIDVSCLRYEIMLTSTLVIFCLFVEVTSTILLLLYLDICSQLCAVLIATVISPPMTEISDRLFNCVSKAFTEINNRVTRNFEVVQRRDLDVFQKSFTRVRIICRSVTLLVTLISIFLFTAASSVVVYSSVENNNNNTNTVYTDFNSIPTYDLAINAGIGLTAIGVFALIIYTLSRILVKNENVSPECMAMFIFFTASFSMLQLNYYFPAAAALGAVVGAFAIRLSTGFRIDAAKILSGVWPHTSALFNISFAFITIGYYCSSMEITHSITLIWKIIVVNLIVFIMKFISLLAICRYFIKNWLCCVLLTVMVSSKGAEQTALATVVPLKSPDLTLMNRFMQESMFLQLYVLLNYLVVTPCLCVIVKYVVFRLDRMY